MEANYPILISLLAYGVFMLAASLFWMRRVRNSGDYLMGGRSLPWWVQAGTFTATGIGTGVTVGAAGLAYRSGWAGFTYPAAIGLGLVFVGSFYARMRRYRFMTLSEEIACYYNNDRLVFARLFPLQAAWRRPKSSTRRTGAGVAVNRRPGWTLQGAIDTPSTRVLLP